MGAGDQSVNLVAEITDPDSIALLAAQPEGHADAPRGRFTDLLAEAGIGAAPDTRNAASGQTGFLRQQRDRVRTLGGSPNERTTLVRRLSGPKRPWRCGGCVRAAVRSARRLLLGAALLAAMLTGASAMAQTEPATATATAAGTGMAAGAEMSGLSGMPFFDLTLRDARSNQELALSLQLLLLLAVLSLAPSIIILMTSFLRLAIVLQFVKRALSLTEMPPNQVLMGVALFLTAFIMWPTFEAINRDALQPFARGELQADELLLRAEAPVREFMFRQLGNDADTFACSCGCAISPSRALAPTCPPTS